MINGTRSRTLLPGRPDTVGVTASDNRPFVEAVPRYRTGIPWRDLPERLGDWKNVPIQPLGGLWCVGKGSFCIWLPMRTMNTR